MKKEAKSWLEISRSALRSNVKNLRKLNNQSDFMAVVKSNAYGHGLELVVSAVDDLVDWFGVDSLDEGKSIRKVGSKKPVLILGYTPKGRLAEVQRGGFRQVIYDRSTARRLNDLASSRKPAVVHVKVETGTSRQGVDPKKLLSLLSFLEKLPNVRVEGLYTHFANVEDTSDLSYARLQLSRFRQVADESEKLLGRPLLLHTACSAAAIVHPDTRFDLVRVGISLYGLWSSEEVKKTARKKGLNLELRPVLTWKSRVAQVKDLVAGTPVSYGLTESVKQNSKVAIVPVGYWDGFDRRLSSVGKVLIKGKRAKVLGRVCMNMHVVDITNIKNVKEGDPVVLLGQSQKDQITAEEMAKSVGTINYEIVTRINPLLPRELVR